MTYKNFRYNFFSALTHPPIYFVYGLYLPIIFFLYYDAILHAHQNSFLLFLSGLFIWTITEYIIHRFVFHHKSKFAIFNRFQFFIHGYHHLKPTDFSRYVLPIFITIPASICFLLILNYFFKANASGICSGVIFGYLLYDSTHYAVHRFKPRTQIGKFLKHHHFYHHFKDNQRCFGVSTTFWDYIFKTK